MICPSLGGEGARRVGTNGGQTSVENGMVPDSPDTVEALRRAVEGDGEALGELFAHHGPRLRRMVQLRMDRRLVGRLDPSDVLQEAYLEVAKGLGDYLGDPQLPFFVWLRFLTGRKLRALHRHHLGTAARDARREVGLGYESLPPTSSDILAAELVGQDPSPSQALIRAELQTQLQEVLDGMDRLDREVLVLRHFEQLTNAETAAALGLTTSAASKRFIRALERLRSILVTAPGSLEQPHLQP